MPGSNPGGPGRGAARVPGSGPGRGAAAVPGGAASAAVVPRGAASAAVPAPGKAPEDGFGPGHGFGEGPGDGDGFGEGPDGFGAGPDGFGDGSADGFGDGFGEGPGDGDGPGDRFANGTGTIAVARVGGAAGVPEKGVAKAAAAVPEKAGSGSGPGGEPEGGLRGELRQKLRTQRRLRLITLSTLAAVVLLVLPAFFGLRAVASDPVFASLDALNVPAWADKNPQDVATGSRWCFFECRLRERLADSEHPFQETAQAYTKALEEAGWQRWKVKGCPEVRVDPENGVYSCWKRDEYNLDMLVSLPGCAVDQVAQEAVPPAGSDAAEAGETGAGKCEGSTVSIKVQYEIGDERGKVDKNPGPVGVTPEPTLDDADPLLEPTPQAS
ncbi:integrin beta 3 [Actinoplanes octamycinicus]|uniref:Integrin beta 3 n=1 Tax=Actinoplanes octamycinicus TaxID=135948 RepID=A0A7W7MCT4_9ACTN|nr:hypothetical protein [Actinoplanes octamycinicus]MBB4745489.1 integrin beta 3 [Actinoplanes octamycinicus]